MGGKRINLALQGGGAHGAFTWGVLDRLLEDGRLEIAAISGASAGAMNAVVVAQGIEQGGPEGGRAALARFWREVARAGAASPIQRSPLAVLFGDWTLTTSPGYLAFDLLSRIASPYDLNPLDLNPLRDLLAAEVDFDKVRACAQVELLIAATNVETGRGRVFRRHELDLDVLMASACLPLLFKAVKIGDENYWDGGYMGNPPVSPFFDVSDSDDVVIVQINPVLRTEPPRRAHEILNRLNEITFNSALLHELKTIDLVNRLLRSGALAPGRYREKHIHVVTARKRMRELDASSKLNAEWEFLQLLFEIGRESASDWLAKNFDRIGSASSLDVGCFLSGPIARVEAGE